MKAVLWLVKRAYFSGTAKLSVEWGARAGLKSLSNRAATRKLFLAFLGGFGGMLPQKILKIKYLGLAENAFPKILQLIFLVSQKR